MAQVPNRVSIVQNVGVTIVHLGVAGAKSECLLWRGRSIWGYFHSGEFSLFPLKIAVQIDTPEKLKMYVRFTFVPRVVPPLKTKVNLRYRLP